MADNKSLQLDEGFTDTSDELDEGFAPVEVSPEESEMLMDYIKAPVTSGPEAFLHGAERGATFDFADELSGALGTSLEGSLGGAAADVVSQMRGIPEASGESEADRLSRLYKEYRDISRQRYKQAEEDQPAASMLGNIAGGFAVPGLGSIGQISKQASLPLKMQAGVRVGTPAGALYGAGASEAETLPEFGEDVLVGGEMGAALGMVAPPVISSAKKTAGGARDVAGWFADLVAEPFKIGQKHGKKGELLVGRKAEQRVQKEITEFGGELPKQIQNDLNKLGQKRNELIEQASKQGIKLDPQQVDDYIGKYLSQDMETNLPEVTREIEQFKEILRTSKEGPLVDKIKEVFVPKEGKTQMGKFADKFERLKAEQRAIPGSTAPHPLELIFEPTDLPDKVVGIIRQPQFDDLGNFSGYKKVASQLLDKVEGADLKMISERVRAGGRDLQSPEQMFKLYKDLEQKAQTFGSKEAQQMSSKAAQEGKELMREAVPEARALDQQISSSKEAAKNIGIPDTQDIDPQETMKRLTGLINQLESGGGTGGKARQILDNFYEELKKVDPTRAEELKEQMQTMGEKAFISQGALKVYLPRIMATPRAWTMAAGNLVGYAQQKLATKTPEQLTQMAAKFRSLKESKAAQYLSRELDRAGQKVSEKERNAILFGAMQNPKYRELLVEEETGEKLDGR